MTTATAAATSTTSITISCIVSFFIIYFSMIRTVHPRSSASLIESNRFFFPRVSLWVITKRPGSISIWRLPYFLSRVVETIGTLQSFRPNSLTLSKPASLIALANVSAALFSCSMLPSRRKIHKPVLGERRIPFTSLLPYSRCSI